MRRSVRIAVTGQLERSAREAGFEVYRLPELPTYDFHRGLQQRLSDGQIIRPFLEEHDIELVLDFNTEALTLSPSNDDASHLALTTATLGIPYVACYLDPITSVMNEIRWEDQWKLLEDRSWIKWIWESAHAEELKKLGVTNVITMPMAATNDDFDTSALPEPDPGPAVAFMGHPASSWFRSNQPIHSGRLLAGLTAAAVNAGMPDLAFHQIYYDLYGFSTPPGADEEFPVRAQKSLAYFQEKFAYNAYLAVRQRDRFSRFLKMRLGNAFELIGDHWEKDCGLPHTPRIWDMKVLHDRMRRVPICLNLMKGNLETGLNVRHFEITAYGGFMLTYWTPELESCFVVGQECDAFRNEAELLEKIAYYLDHPDDRRQIAAAGQRRTLSEHLYSHRIMRLVELLRESNILPTTTPTEAPILQVVPA